MTLDINGYTSVFRTFVDFAQQRMDKNDGKAVACVRMHQPLTGRDLAVTKSLTDEVHKWKRTSDESALNDRTRMLFKKAIVEMFGSVTNIPASVQKAMLLGDYDCGKPLTARRIMAVKRAIDADGTARARSAKIALETFQSAEVKAAALELGFTKAELPKLALAAHLYAQTEGIDEMAAMTAVAEPNSKANRLMQYGGRFLESAENFADGLRLMDSFRDWLTAVCDTKKADGNTYANASTVTDLNYSIHLANRNCLVAFERFVFEDLSVNPGANLKETDPEKIFGVKNNAAMRFFSTERYGNFTGVVASVPPERRAAIYAVFDKLTLPLPETKEAARAHYAMRTSDRGIHDPNIVIGRILRHLPEIERLMAKGSLTEKNIAKTLFPDMPSRDWTRNGINGFTRNVGNRVQLRLQGEGMNEMEAISAGGKVQLIMEETCCTFEEAFEAFQTGRRVAPPRYMTTATFPFEDLDGTTRAARKQLDDNTSGDLWRPYDYSPVGDQNNQDKYYIKDATKIAFGFTFPDGTALKANPNDHAGNIPTILDKLEALAGRVHPRQQSALLFAVSQAGTGVLKGGLTAFGIFSTEHACVNFELSRDERTGAITVKYTSPEELPLRFSWTATIDVAGRMTSTPLVVTDKNEPLHGEGEQIHI